MPEPPLMATASSSQPSINGGASELPHGLHNGYGSQQMGSGFVPVPAIVRDSGQVFAEIQIFNDWLWSTNPALCRSVFTDMFPRGVDGCGATQAEEDAFILRFFDEHTFREQGGRFLKTILYNIARYNDDRVIKGAQKWEQENQDLIVDKNYLPHTLRAETTRAFFDENEALFYHRDEALLFRIMRAVQFKLRHFPHGEPSETEQTVPGLVDSVSILGTSREPTKRSTTESAQSSIATAHGPEGSDDKINAEEIGLPAPIRRTASESTLIVKSNYRFADDSGDESALSRPRRTQSVDRSPPAPNADSEAIDYGVKKSVSTPVMVSRKIPVEELFQRDTSERVQLQSNQIVDQHNGQRSDSTMVDHEPVAVTPQRTTSAATQTPTRTLNGPLQARDTQKRVNDSDLAHHDDASQPNETRQTKMSDRRSSISSRGSRLSTRGKGRGRGGSNNHAQSHSGHSRHASGHSRHQSSQENRPFNPQAQHGYGARRHDRPFQPRDFNHRNSMDGRQMFYNQHFSNGRMNGGPPQIGPNGMVQPHAPGSAGPAQYASHAGLGSGPPPFMPFGPPLPQMHNMPPRADEIAVFGLPLNFPESEIIAILQGLFPSKELPISIEIRADATYLKYANPVTAMEIVMQPPALCLGGALVYFDFSRRRSFPNTSRQNFQGRQRPSVPISAVNQGVVSSFPDAQRRDHAGFPPTPATYDHSRNSSMITYNGQAGPSFDSFPSQQARPFNYRRGTSSHPDDGVNRRRTPAWVVKNAAGERLPTATLGDARLIGSQGDTPQNSERASFGRYPQGGLTGSGPGAFDQIDANSETQFSKKYKGSWNKGDRTNSARHVSEQIRGAESRETEATQSTTDSGERGEQAQEHAENPHDPVQSPKLAPVITLALPKRPQFARNNKETAAEADAVASKEAAMAEATPYIEKVHHQLTSVTPTADKLRSTSESLPVVGGDMESMRPMSPRAWSEVPVPVTLCSDPVGTHSSERKDPELLTPRRSTTAQFSNVAQSGADGIDDSFRTATESPIMDSPHNLQKSSHSKEANEHAESLVPRAVSEHVTSSREDNEKECVPQKGHIEHCQPKSEETAEPLTSGRDDHIQAAPERATEVVLPGSSRASEIGAKSPPFSEAAQSVPDTMDAIQEPPTDVPAKSQDIKKSKGKALIPGPRQTESLSPYARVPSKSDKKSKQKRKSSLKISMIPQDTTAEIHEEPSPPAVSTRTDETTSVVKESSDIAPSQSADANREIEVPKSKSASTKARMKLLKTIPSRIRGAFSGASSPPKPSAVLATQPLACTPVPEVLDAAAVKNPADEMEDYGPPESFALTPPKSTKCAKACEKGKENHPVSHSNIETSERSGEQSPVRLQVFDRHRKVPNPNASLMEPLNDTKLPGSHGPRAEIDCASDSSHTLTSPSLSFNDSNSHINSGAMHPTELHESDVGPEDPAKAKKPKKKRSKARSRHEVPEDDTSAREAAEQNDVRQAAQIITLLQPSDEPANNNANKRKREDGQRTLSADPQSPHGANIITTASPSVVQNRDEKEVALDSSDGKIVVAKSKSSRKKNRNRKMATVAASSSGDTASNSINQHHNISGTSEAPAVSGATDEESKERTMHFLSQFLTPQEASEQDTERFYLHRVVDEKLHFATVSRETAKRPAIDHCLSYWKNKREVASEMPSTIRPDFTRDRFEKEVLAEAFRPASLEDQFNYVKQQTRRDDVVTQRSQALEASRLIEERHSKVMMRSGPDTRVETGGDDPESMLRMIQSRITEVEGRSLR